jgi:phosphate transport system permease protein
MTVAAPERPPVKSPAEKPPRQRPRRARSSVLANGEAMLWLTGGALAIALVMIVGLLLLVFVQGTKTFWPVPVVEMRLSDGKALMGEITRTEDLPEQPGDSIGMKRWLLRTGNFKESGSHFDWVHVRDLQQQMAPEWAVVVERTEWGRFYGVPTAFVIDGQPAVSDSASAWKEFERVHSEVRARWHERKKIERHDIGEVNRRQEEARLEAREAEMTHGAGSPEHKAALELSEKADAEAEAEFARLREKIDAINQENAKFAMRFRMANGEETDLQLADIVRAYPANQLGIFGKTGVYLSRWWEYLTDEPREANSEGGVFPAIFGTAAMTLIMCILVVPFGVLAALYLREYAKGGAIVSIVRIAVNNLAGVPSIVFGVFGLGFFCYIIGASIDEVFFEASLPNPTLGKGGLMWASFTLALLTLPVVIVATEEALAAVPNSMREGSYACGASKWQTIQRIVLPRAMPGIMTGMVLAIARGAGEVAPLMLVGAVKLAPDLPIDGTYPFLHPERSFMHLGFHIYDLGFQSQNSEAAKPMVFTTTLLLIALVALLNLAAIWIRSRLRRKFVAAHF